MPNENNNNSTEQKSNPENTVQNKEVEDCNKKIQGLKLDIAKLSFDLPVCYYYIDSSYAHIMWIGLTGTISSAIGVYQTWS